MDQNLILYNDPFVTLRSDILIIKNYYFPFGKCKTINISDIESVSIEPLTLLTGKYRIWGSGNLKMWFPMDGGRMKRDRVFIFQLRMQKIFPAVTVKDSGEFELQLRKAKIALK